MRSNLDIGSQQKDIGSPQDFRSQPDTGQHSEGRLARRIEQQTAKLPSDLFLWAALGAMGVGFYLEVTGREEKGHWVGQWVAPILVLGLYNKIVKIAGSDRTS